MTIRHSPARTAALIVAGIVAAFYGLLVWVAPPATADPVLHVRWRVDASTHLATLDREVTVPRGMFEGDIDLGTGEIIGNLALPQATVRLDAVPGLLPLADATFEIEQAQPISGQLDLAEAYVNATAVFNIHVVSVRPVGLPTNLVGDSCVTSEPITVPMEGYVDLFAGSTFSGTYTIPPLENCGLLTTQALNLLMAGPGNTFTGTFTPIPPPVANAGSDLTVASEATFELDATGSSDPENRELTYLWTQIGGPAAVLTNERTTRPTVKAPPGPVTLTFRVTVTNTDEISRTDDVIVTVRAPK
jgi:hypothetical protein